MGSGSSDNADSEQARDSVIQLLKELAGGRFMVTSRREDWPRALVRKVALNLFNRERSRGVPSVAILERRVFRRRAGRF